MPRQHFKGALASSPSSYISLLRHSSKRPSLVWGFLADPSHWALFWLPSSWAQLIARLPSPSPLGFNQQPQKRPTCCPVLRYIYWPWATAEPLVAKASATRAPSRRHISCPTRLKPSAHVDQSRQQTKTPPARFIWQHPMKKTPAFVCWFLLILLSYSCYTPPPRSTWFRSAKPWPWACKQQNEG